MTAASPKGGIIKAILLTLLLGLCVNLGIALFLDRGIFFGALNMVRWPVVVVPFLCYALIYGVDYLRLKIVLSQFRERLGLLPGLANGLLTVFFSNITPMATGGQPFQIWHLSYHGVDTKRAANLVLSRHAEFLLTSVALLMVFAPRVVRIARVVSGGSGALGSGIFYAGLATTLLLGTVFILVMVRPDLLGRLAYSIEHSPLGRLIARISGRKEWAHRFYQWSCVLRKEIEYLWSSKLPYMLVDILFGLVNLALQGLSLYFVLTFFAGRKLNYIDVAVTFILVNMVVYYIPTPGASGSTEGAYSLVFAGMVGSYERCLAGVAVWRLATYYLHIALGFFVFLIHTRRSPDKPASQEQVQEDENACE